MRALTIVGIALLLLSTAAASAQNVQAAYTQYQLEQNDCTARHQRGELKSMESGIACLSIARRKYAMAIGFPWLDLLDSDSDGQGALARQYDEGKISKAMFAAESTQLLQVTTSAIQQRAAALNQQLAAQQQTQQTQQQADEARRLARLRCFAAMGQPTRTGSFGEAVSNCLRAAAGLPPPAAPVNTTCQWIGSQFVCTSQ